MVFEKPGLGRRLAAGGIDLYNFCYVALLPVVIVGAVAFWREGSMIRDEVGRARAMPKGQWKVDATREAALGKTRDELAQKLFGDVNTQSMKFLNGLAPMLDADQAFKSTLDSLIDHPYTVLANKTFEQGKGALRRHLQTPAGGKSLSEVQAALSAAAHQRVTEYIRAELDYRLEQIAGYLGWDGLWEKLRDWLRGKPTQAPSPTAAERVSEALHWTHLLDKIVSGNLRIVPATAQNLGLMRLALFLAGGIALLFLALRDALGRNGSPGKRHAGLHIVDARTGVPASAGQRIVRGVVLVLLLPIECVLALFDQRIGDRVAHTRVVKEEEPAA